MSSRTALAGLVVLLTSAGPPAFAQSCGDRDDMITELGELYGEQPVAAGLRDENHLVELFATNDGATWTMLLSRADGFTCVLGAGRAWSDHVARELADMEG